MGTHGVLIVTRNVVCDVGEKLAEECHLKELVVGKQVQSSDGGGLETCGKRPVGKRTSSLLLNGNQLGEAGIGESRRSGIEIAGKGGDTGDGNSQCGDDRHAHLDDWVCEMGRVERWQNWGILYAVKDEGERMWERGRN